MFSFQSHFGFFFSLHSWSNCISFIPLPNPCISFFSSSVFRYPSLPKWASSPQRWGRSSGKAGSSRRCWHNQDVSSQGDAGVSGWDREGCRSCSNNSCTHTHIFPICSSLFITSHLHVLISWQEVERHRKNERPKNEVNREGEKRLFFKFWFFLLW